MEKTNRIFDSLKKNAGTFPGKTAFLEAGGASLTWGELFAKVTALAKRINDLPADDPDRPVAVFVGRDVQSVVSLLACAVSTRWYVAIDSELPAERVSSLLSLCRPCAAVVHPSAGPLPDGLTAIDPRQDPDQPVTSLPVRDAALPMFGIFTSGSTGTPKLVVKSRRAMTSFIDVYVEQFGFGSEDVFGNQIPFYFDASTKDLFATVAAGACCVIIPQKNFSFPVGLISLLNEYRVSSIVWVPSALSIAAKFNVFSAAKPLYLKKVLFVGEKMPLKYLRVWMEALPQAQFVNLYGSTEVAGNSCFYEVPRDIPENSVIPVGKPFRGTRVFIIDPDTARESETGEICVAGPGLAEGYYSDPEKTASVFRTLEAGDFKGRVYFSGDIGRLDGAGNVVCLSRRDSQIKHMGHRIELGEIENAALGVGFVTEACVQYDAEKEKIILFYSSAEEQNRGLRQRLAALLPRYMLPHVIKYLPELPHNRNGKLDRAALREMI